MRDFELWIDESGDFEKNTQKNMSILPSLIGGVLIEKGKITSGILNDLVDEGPGGIKPHAMDLPREKMENVVLPALEKVHALGGRLVYFENSERLDIYSNRELYLRMLSGGLLQLMQVLAGQGDFILDVMIASRYIRTGGAAELEKIEDEAYLDSLIKYLQKARTDGFFELGTDSRLNFCILSARQERRLVLADFACNARISRYSSRKFNDEMRRKLDELIDEDYVFSVNVRSSKSYILSRIGSGNISSAIMELFTGRGNESRQRIYQLVLDRLHNMSYQHRCSQVLNLSRAIVSYTRRERDMETAEQVLKDFLYEFLPMIHSCDLHVQTDSAELEASLALAGLYLREGDLIMAKDQVQKIGKILGEMNYRMEHAVYLFDFSLLRSELLAMCMDVDGALDILGSAIHTLDEVMTVLACEEKLAGYFRTESSLESNLMARARALRVKIAAGNLKHDPQRLYPMLKEDIDCVLRNSEYVGETVPTRLYMAYALARVGQFGSAAWWLCQSAKIMLEEDDRIPEDADSIEEISRMETIPSGEDFERFLERTGRFDKYTQAERLNIYVSIMLMMMRSQKKELAGIMHRALQGRKDLFARFLNPDLQESDLRSDLKKDISIYRDILWEAFGSRPAVYHPAEKINWYYGTYLWLEGNKKGAREQWKMAAAACAQHPDYLLMRLTSLYVHLESFALEAEGSLAEKEAHRRALNIEAEAENILQMEEIPDKMKEKVSDIYNMVRGFGEADESGKKLTVRKILIMCRSL